MTSIIINAQTPCELDTSFSIPGGNFEKLDSSYLTPFDTTIGNSDTLPADTQVPPPPPLSDSTRFVVWLHGLGGNSAAWSRMASAFSRYSIKFPEYSRKIESHIPSYDELEDAGDLVDISSLKYGDKSFLPTQLPGNINPEYLPNRTILIGHSQGGLIARAMDLTKSKPGIENNFGGLATFCTSNQGAQIINNQNMAKQLLFDMGNALTDGYIESIDHSDKFFVRLAGNVLKLDNIKDYIAQFASNHVGNFLINENLPAITESYKVGSSSINSLNTYISESEDIVAFYSRARLKNEVPHIDTIITYRVTANILGQIDIDINIHVDTFDMPVPISLRTLHYFIKSPQSYDHFTAEDHFDTFAINFHKNILFYQSKVDREQALIEFCNGVTKPWENGFRECYWGGKRNRAIKRRRAWQKGVDFLEDFDRRYRAFVGILDRDVQVEDRKYCICEETGVPNPVESGPYPLDFDCSTISDPENECNEEIRPTNIFKGWINHHSDGIVLEKSQKSIPQATVRPVRIYDNDYGGATHMEVRNTKMTRDRLVEFFDGDHGEFFWTPKF